MYVGIRRGGQHDSHLLDLSACLQYCIYCFIVYTIDLK